MALQAIQTASLSGIYDNGYERIPNYHVRPSTPYEDDDDSLPKDPRQWTRDHVAQWLSYVTAAHGLPEVSSSRFLMNGKALCLMSPGMFLNRVPLGGKLLYKDFQLRLSAALYGNGHH